MTSQDLTLKIVAVDKLSQPGRFILTLRLGDKTTTVSTPADGNDTEEDRALMMQAHRELGLLP